MDAGVQHVTRDVMSVVREKLPRPGGGGSDEDGSEGEDVPEGATEGNPWAAMPSDYLAAAVVTAMCLAEISRTAGAAGWAYVVASGFIVVYLGEHYLVDLIAALALAEGVRRVEPVVVPVLRGSLAALRALERAAL